MTERERQILDLIRRNPFIAQNEIASTLGITRSSVAVHITNLMKKGYIKGKGYVIDEENYVVCIGGANVDIQGFASQDIVHSDSNPGRMEISAGGVSRNIGENLARMGARVKLITAVGDDVYADVIRQSCLSANMDISGIQVVPGKRSSTYLAITGPDGTLDVGLSDMRIIKSMNADFVKSHHHVLENAQIIVADPGLSPDCFFYVANNYAHVPLFADTVSAAYAKVVKSCLGRFHTVTPNIKEAEVLAEMKICTPGDLEQAARKILSHGVGRVIITLGDDGVLYMDADGNVLRAPARVHPKAINTTGSGGAFMAGLVYSYLQGYDIPKTLDFSMTASAIAACHENTINPNICEDLILDTMKEWKTL